MQNCFSSRDRRSERVGPVLRSGKQTDLSVNHLQEHFSMKNQVINFIKIKMLRLTLELQKSDASVCVCVCVYTIGILHSSESSDRSCRLSC